MLKTFLQAMMVVCLFAVTAFAQEYGLRCDDRNWRGDGYSRCLMREMTVPAAKQIVVDGRLNGGVSVKGWARNEVLVRVKIEAHAKSSEAEASALVDQIRIETNGGNIRAEGPNAGDKQNWSASFEVFVPRETDLSLKTYNGGISITEVSGRIEFDAHNGGVSLQRLAGMVRGQTLNGGLSIDLVGPRWNGEGIDVKTMNGGVNLSIPSDYSARLETSTVNGGLKVEFPVTVQGEISRELSLNLGNGGPTIRAVTTNGGVSVRKKG
jgi:DUF4097 and DUF4098 domain-containing protein YvlB